MRAIPLNQGKQVLVDDEDYAYLRTWIWSWSPRHPYAHRWSNGVDGKRRLVQLHRVVAKARPGETVDHADGDPLNCQRANLRKATTTQNNQNVRAGRNNRSGYRGVHYEARRGKYRAQIQADGVRHFLGYFASAEEAAAARDAAARTLHGSFARLTSTHEPALPAGRRHTEDEGR